MEIFNLHKVSRIYFGQLIEQCKPFFRQILSAESILSSAFVNIEWKSVRKDAVYNPLQTSETIFNAKIPFWEWIFRIFSISTTSRLFHPKFTWIFSFIIEKKLTDSLMKRAFNWELVIANLICKLNFQSFAYRIYSQASSLGQLNKISSLWIFHDLPSRFLKAVPLITFLFIAHILYKSIQFDQQSSLPNRTFPRQWSVPSTTSPSKLENAPIRWKVPRRVLKEEEEKVLLEQPAE